MDVEIQEMCLKHAKGKPVTITRGGNRVRLRTSMPNGGVTLVSYDTRVTSQVCGRVIYVHPDNTEVIQYLLGVCYVHNASSRMIIMPSLRASH